MPFVSFLGENDGVGEVMVHRAERFLPIGTFTQDVLRGPSAFSVGERELIAAYVSALNQCQFCTGVHSSVAAANGIDEALLRAIVDDLDVAPVDERLRPVLRYVRKLTEAPAKMTQADADAVYAAGWDENALADAVEICALFNFYNRLVEGHGVKGSQDYFERATEFLGRHGYAARTRQAVESKRSAS